MEKPTEIIAARRDYDDESNIQLHAVKETKVPDRQFPMIYVTVSYKDEVKNLEVLTEVFKQGESPYLDDVTRTPYIVIENRVYYLDDFTSLDLDTDVEIIIENDDSEEPAKGVLYVED